MKDAIRLTNKTAVALRRNAKDVRTAYFVAQVIVSVVLGAAGVLLGFVWLPAVPLMIVAIALIDSALSVASRSRYLSLIAQAICTEAAAREMRETQETGARKHSKKPHFEQPKQEEDEREQLAAHRRRRQSDSPNPLTLMRSEP